MQTVTFTKAFTIDVDAATKLTYPEGWTGPVDDDIAEMAAEEGCIKDAAPEASDAPVDEAPAAPAKGKSKATDADAPPA